MLKNIIYWNEPFVAVVSQDNVVRQYSARDNFLFNVAKIDWSLQQNLYVK